jgi:hypothetical protein
MSCRTALCARQDRQSAWRAGDTSPAWLARAYLKPVAAQQTIAPAGVRRIGNTVRRARSRGCGGAVGTRRAKNAKYLHGG